MQGKELQVQSELFTASDVARFCEVDLKTIHNWAEKGVIRHFRTPGRHLRFRRLDVVDFLRKYGYSVPDVLRLGKPRVVVMDSDPDTLGAIRKALARRFELTTFEEPLDALLAIGALQPDALVFDVQMQGLDGLRLLHRIRSVEATSHMRTIAMARDQQLRTSALEAGAHDFLCKTDMSELKERLERLMGLDRA